MVYAQRNQHDSRECESRFDLECEHLDADEPGRQRQQINR